MPLSEDVRHELAGVEPLKHCDRLAELSGLFHTPAASTSWDNGEFSVHLDLAESAVAAGPSGSCARLGSRPRSAPTRATPFERGTRYQLHLPGSPARWRC